MIGEGAYSHVYAWSPGRVLKLFKTSVPRWLAEWESHVTRAVAAAGGPAPEVYDEVIVDGRFGMVLGRFDGPTLLQLTRSGAMTFEQAGAQLASVGATVHGTPAPPDLVWLRDSVESSLRWAGSVLPEPIVQGMRVLLERLPPGDGLCHGDLHPDNVIVTEQGPRVIDWIGAVRAPAAFDLACTEILLTELAPEVADDPQRPRAVHAAAHSEYARLAGVSDADLAAAIEPHLPIACLRVLLGPAASAALRARLTQRIEVTLRATG